MASLTMNSVFSIGADKRVPLSNEGLKTQALNFQGLLSDDDVDLDNSAYMRFLATFLKKFTDKHGRVLGTKIKLTPGQAISYVNRLTQEQVESLSVSDRAELIRLIALLPSTSKTDPKTFMISDEPIKAKPLTRLLNAYQHEARFKKKLEGYRAVIQSDIHNILDRVSKKLKLQTPLRLDTVLEDHPDLFVNRKKGGFYPDTFYQHLVAEFSKVFGVSPTELDAARPYAGPYPSGGEGSFSPIDGSLTLQTAEGADIKHIIGVVFHEFCHMARYEDIKSFLKNKNTVTAENIDQYADLAMTAVTEQKNLKTILDYRARRENLYSARALEKEAFRESDALALSLKRMKP